MIRCQKLIILAVLILSVLSAKLKAGGSKKEEGRTIVEANHFFSDKQLKATYDIKKIKTDLSLIVVLRPKEQDQVLTNAVELTLVSNQKLTTCKFTTFDSVCVLEEVQSTDIKLKLKCDSLPCQISWTVYQSKPITPVAMQSLDQLYKMDQSDQHTIAIVTCNSPEVKDFTKSLQMHSSNQFTRSTSSSTVYFLFKKQIKGYMFFKVPKEAKACGQLAFYHVPDTIKPDTNVRDFIIADEKSSFAFDRPKGLFRIDASMHQLFKNKPVMSSLMIEITGEKGGKRQTIRNSTIRPLGLKKSYEFSYLSMPISDSYKHLQFEFKSSDKMLMLNAQLSLSEIPEVEKGEITYFSLKKGEKIKYKLIEEKDAEDSEIIKMMQSDKEKLKLSETSCSSKKGCEFTVQANEDIDLGSIYFSGNAEQTQQKEDFVTYDIDKSVTKKISDGDFQYYKKHITGKKSFQVVVNTPNVIIWAANIKKCENPTKQCYEKVGNNQHSFLYEVKEDSDIIFGVQGLDSCEYTLTIIMSDEEYIVLQNSVAFSYEMDDEQTQLIFRFKVPEKHRISFNLISPLHSLKLLVNNNEKKPSDEETQLQSLDGYLLVEAKEMQGNKFTILVSKTKQFANKYVHFSIIASTSGSNLRLQPSLSHYQTFAAQVSREFVFEFETDEEYIINMYTHNLIGQELAIKMLVSNKDDDWKSEDTIIFQIEKTADSLNLKEISEQLCKKQGETSCEIFLKITNQMDVEIDLTITLMIENSVIELNDGLWQSFSMNKISTSSHFYFFPKHADKSVSIVYKSTYNDLRIVYTLWKAEDKTIDPTDWPFPKSVEDYDDQKSKNYLTFQYRPTKHIDISKDTIKKCWPSCVVLISLLQDDSLYNMKNTDFDNRYQKDQFSILASNNMIEIPEKYKLDIVMAENQEKFLLIDVKYAKDKDAITIFTSITIGNLDFYGSVYSETNPRCPSEDDSDFYFGKLETQIQKETLNDRLRDNNMQDDRNIYICLLAKSTTVTKFYIEWTSEEEMIKVLDLDSFETVSIGTGPAKVFQVTPRLQKYQLKFTRNFGFPFIRISKCDGKDDYEDCLENGKDGSEKKQMISKTEMYTEDACENCIIFISISAEQQTAGLQIHVQSQYSELEVKENVLISDFIDSGEENKYLLTSVSDEETIININVLEGSVQVSVVDFGAVNIKRNSKDKGNNIHIVIPSSDHKPAKKSKNDNADALSFQMLLGQPYFGTQTIGGTMRYFHMTITSDKKGMAASYTVTYSSGDRQVYLQDGMIMDYTLQPKKQTIFYYQNVYSKSHIMLSMSMESSSDLFKLSTKMFYFVDPEDEDTQQEFTPDKPPMRKSTPSPNVVYALPDNHKLFSIHLTNPSGKDQKVTLMVNHIELMILPFLHQFPFQLHTDDTLKLLVDVVNPGYLLIDVKKCDESSPQFAYTLDEDSFQNEEYTYTTFLNDDPNFQYIVKVDNPGTLFMMFKTQAGETSVMSVQVSHSADKIKGTKAKPGNRGTLDYQLLDSQTAEISFVGGTCSGAKCSGDVSYYTLSSLDMPSLYSQTVCPSSFFNTDEVQSVKPLNITKITNKPDSKNKITFTYKLLDPISYISVKGIYSNSQEIYYRPIEIVTLWGHLSRTSSSHTFGVLLVMICGCCVLLICYRRWANAKKGYKPLEDDKE